MIQTPTYNMKTDFYGLEFVTCQELGRLAVILDIQNGVESIIYLTTEKEEFRISMEEAQQKFDSGKWTVTVPFQSAE